MKELWRRFKWWLFWQPHHVYWFGVRHKIIDPYEHGPPWK